MKKKTIASLGVWIGYIVLSYGTYKNYLMPIIIGMLLIVLCIIGKELVE